MANIKNSDLSGQGAAFWNISAEQLLTLLNASPQGLSDEEAILRAKRYGANRLHGKKQSGAWRLLLAQFKSSIILLLLFATGLSFFLHDRLDAAIILAIVLVSGLLGFWQEKGAAAAIEKLLTIVQIKVTVLRNGAETEIATENLVTGDIILLKAGGIIPADCLILEADNLFVDEAGMRFLGFLVFVDPPKANCVDTIMRLRDLGVTLKIITGDNQLVAETVSRELGLAGTKILTGPEIAQLSGLSLMQKVAETDLFAEVEPNQKERIVMALKKAGYVVGYMGDGINDVSALHAADVGISVDSAADIAKESAQIVLLEKDLGVLVQGVREGRITFANTLKYVFMATSSNFGNMFSMAGASLFLPFLPLLPKQILLTNLLTDFPEMTIASDNVDADMVKQPRRWDIKFIRRFMITFGMVSSLFDFLTFGVLLLLQVPEAQFRTAWFLESVVSAAMIVFVVRSSKPCFKSRPGQYLAASTLAIVAVTLALPYTPIARFAGFQPLPSPVLGYLAIIVALYFTTGEIAKGIFYRLVKMQ